MIEISKRLEGVSRLVKPSVTLVDVGTDHGYVPIYLIYKKIIRKAIAMDINRGPLERAKENIHENRMDDVIETRLSDGLSALLKNEADTAVIAGMGGKLMIRILSKNEEMVKEFSSIVLQPQSHIADVRRYLTDHGYYFEEEDMIEEMGKFYPMMRIVPGAKEIYSTCEYTYGKRLLEKKNPTLKRFLIKEASIKEKLLEELSVSVSVNAQIRKKDLRGELERIREGLSCF